MKKTKETNRFCFICFRSLKDIHSVAVGDESMCEKCHSEYWDWVKQGKAIMAFRGASVRCNKHLADLRR